MNAFEQFTKDSQDAQCAGNVRSFATFAILASTAAKGFDLLLIGGKFAF